MSKLDISRYPKFGTLHLGLSHCIALSDYIAVILVKNMNYDVHPLLNNNISKNITVYIIKISSGHKILEFLLPFSVTTNPIFRQLTFHQFYFKNLDVSQTYPVSNHKKFRLLMQMHSYL